VVDVTVCEKLPADLTFEEGAVLASVAPAMLLSERIRSGERVLVFGGGGGVGSHACQILRKKQNVKHLVGVASTHPERLLEEPLGYDEVINYNERDVFGVAEFRENPFDVVVDLAGCGTWLRIDDERSPSIVKPASEGGRYLPLTPDAAIFEANSLWGILKPFLFVPLWRAIKSRTWGRRRLPKYTFAHSIDSERSHLTRTIDMASSTSSKGKKLLRAVVDPKGPFPFTTEGVRKAFHLQDSRHVRGKVVISVP